MGFVLEGFKPKYYMDFLFSCAGHIFCMFKIPITGHEGP
jgi:hypothetical protein